MRPTGPYQGLILDALTKEQRQAYVLHRMVTAKYHSALQSEKDNYLFPIQRTLFHELRKSDPDPYRHVASALSGEVSEQGMKLELIERVSELVKRPLARIVKNVKPHILHYWTREGGDYKWDVSTARLCLGAADLVVLECSAQREAVDLRAAEPVYLRLAACSHEI